MEGDKICQTELMFIDLMILVNFSPICQSEISLAGLTNFAIFITACISGNRNWLGGSSIKKKKERKKEKKRREWNENKSTEVIVRVGWSDVVLLELFFQVHPCDLPFLPQFFM